mgnify:CR=1 FL=1
MIMMKMRMKIQVQENKMNYFKQYLISINLITLGMFNLSCDDRIPEETTNATITITEMQAISDIAPINVGEVVSGFSKIRIVVLLKDADDKIIKDGVVTFSCDQAGSFDVISPITDASGEVFVIFDPDDAAEAVDKNSTVSTYEGATITAKYSSDVETTVRFNIYDEQDDVWPYILNISSDVSSIQLDNGATTAEIEVQVFNKNNTSLDDIILSFSSNKGIIESEGTTDSIGTLKMTFRDNGTQEDIGLASIYCSFSHPGFNTTVTDTITIMIGSNSNLLLETTIQLESM